MVLRLRGSDAGSVTANDATTFYRLASDGNTDAVEVMHLHHTYLVLCVICR